MKKTSSVLFFALFIFCTNQLLAQEAPRYKMQMAIEANGKTVNVELSAANYTINRNAYDTASEAKKDKGKSKSPAPLYTEPADFYLSLTLMRVEKDLLALLSNKKIPFSGAIVITDTYGKDGTRKMEFKNASLSSLAENVSTYSASYGSAGSLYLAVKELTIDGIVFTP